MCKSIKRTFSGLLSILAFVSILGGSAWAAEAAAELQALKAATADIKNISGRFVQEKHLSFFNEPVVSRGLFIFARPGRLRWEYLDPSPSGLVCQAGQVVMWNGPAGRRQLEPQGLTAPAKMVADQVMAWMDLDPATLSAMYQIEVTSQSPLTFVLVPKRSEARKVLASMTVEFQPDGRTARQVTLTESRGDKTIITFDQTVINGQLPPDAFTP